jgi:hypothetical protein
VELIESMYACTDCSFAAAAADVAGWWAHASLAALNCCTAAAPSGTWKALQSAAVRHVCSCIMDVFAAHQLLQLHHAFFRLAAIAS